MLRILILGGTGFVGRALIHGLKKDNNYIILLTRNKKKYAISDIEVDEVVEYDLNSEKISEEYLANLDIIINLAGESIQGIRWTLAKKKRILESRLRVVKLIKDSLILSNIKLPILIHASAVGYYGYSSSDKAVNEKAPCGHDFLAEICTKVETEVINASEVINRIIIIRLGIVLGNNKFFKTLSKGFVFQYGITIGKGEQWFSCIHIEDVIKSILFILEKKEISGIVNLVMERPVRYIEFIKIFCKFKKVKRLIVIPEFLAKVLLGEMSELITEGIKVDPEKLLSNGYVFKFGTLEAAIKDIMEG